MINYVETKGVRIHEVLASIYLSCEMRSTLWFTRTIGSLRMDALQHLRLLYRKFQLMLSMPKSSVPIWHQMILVSNIELPSPALSVTSVLMFDYIFILESG